MKYFYKLLLFSLLLLFGLFIPYKTGTWYSYFLGVVGGVIFARLYKDQFVKTVIRLGWVNQFGEESMVGESNSQSGHSKSSLYSGVAGLVGIIVYLIFKQFAGEGAGALLASLCSGAVEGIFLAYTLVVFMLEKKYANNSTNFTDKPYKTYGELKTNSINLSEAELVSCIALLTGDLKDVPVDKVTDNLVEYNLDKKFIERFGLKDVYEFELILQGLKDLEKRGLVVSKEKEIIIDDLLTCLFGTVVLGTKMPDGTFYDKVSHISSQFSKNEDGGYTFTLVSREARYISRVFPRFNLKYLGLAIMLIFFVSVGIYFGMSKQISNNFGSIKTRTYQLDTLTDYSLDELMALAVTTLPQGFAIQEQYRGINLVKSPKASFSDLQLAILHRFIDMTPKQLITSGHVTIIKYQDDEIDTTGNNYLPLDTISFTSGPYIYVNEDTFKGSKLNLIVNDNSLDPVYRNLIHELVHVAQFNESNALVEKELANIHPDNPITLSLIKQGSLFLKSFADVSGWILPEVDREYYHPNLESTQTTDYGKTSILEDMAESVSGVVVTCDSELDQVRVQWVENYLGESVVDLRAGKLPCPSFAAPVKYDYPNLDSDKREDYGNKYDYSDMQIFYNETERSLDVVKNYYQDELNSRGWSGKFADKTVKNDRTEIYNAEFIGNDRQLYIELKGYDNATGYLNPVGTTITVTNGYILKDNL